MTDLTNDPPRPQARFSLDSWAVTIASALVVIATGIPKVFPIHDRAGTLLAYCGRSVNDESTSLIFPNGFDPRGEIFNAHRIVEGDLFLVRDPLQVLTAHESGIENVVAFLTENVTAQQLEQLAALMDDRKCEHLEMF